jgi:hypothetical protein
MKLITEQSYNYSVLEEGTSKDLYIEGIFSTAELKNINQRIYPRAILEREIGKLAKEKVSNKCCYGELGHPDKPELNLDRVALLTKELKWDGDNIIGKAKILETPMGAIAKTLIKEGRLGISSRGLGTVADNGYVNEDYQLLCYDLVQEPSNIGSWVNGIYEDKDFEYPVKKEKVVTVDPEVVLGKARESYHKKIWQVISDIEKNL